MAKKRTHNIHPGLMKLAVPIDTLTLDEHNARTHSERNLDFIAASLSEFQQRKPVVVQETDRIVRAGNGTVMAAQKLGWTHLAALIVVDDDVQAARYAIADNRTAELAEWNWQELSRQMRALHEQDEALLEGLGFVDYEINPLLEANWGAVRPSGNLETDFGNLDKDKDDGSGTSGHSVNFNDGQWVEFQRLAALYRTTMADNDLSMAKVALACMKAWEATLDA